MNHKINFSAEMPDEVFQGIYVALRETYPGTWEDFNGLMMSLGMMMCLSKWDEGLMIIQKQKNLTDQEIANLRLYALVKFMDFLKAKQENLMNVNILLKEVL